MDVSAILQTYGFTQYEAKAFLTVVETGTASAYQISKASGIPRARIYDILESLAGRGVVMTEESHDGQKKYRALPVEVFLQQQKQMWETSYRAVEAELKHLEKKQPPNTAYVNTVKGTDSILAFCQTLLQSAATTIMISMWEPMYRQLLPELAAKREQGVELRGIVFGVEEWLPGLIGHRNSAHIQTVADPDKWFILSVDGRELLYGHSAETDGNAFYTDDPVHLFLMQDYIWHDVLVNKLVEQGNRIELDNWIAPERARFFGQG